MEIVAALSIITKKQPDAHIIYKMISRLRKG
jgi:hypothetical protein